MHNVKFVRLSDNKTKYSYTDFGLLLAPVSLELPDVQTNFVSIPGHDGLLDLTESLGYVNYNNRTITLTFSILEGTNYLVNSNVSNFLHGRRVKLTLPTDSDFYYVGRCTVSGFDRSKTTNQIQVEVNCEPYKYKQSETSVQFSIGSLPYTKIINNLFMPTTPRIITTSTVLMKFKTANYSWNAGEHLNTSIVLDEGENTFTFLTGSSGDVTFRYQEGAL